MKYSGFWIRSLAIFIDFLVLLLPIMLLIIVGLDFLGFIVTWLYFAIMESSKLQGTVGKVSLKLKVTDMQNNRITFLRATIRHFSKALSSTILFMGFVMAGITKKKQGFHDMVASTLVVDGECNMNESAVEDVEDIPLIIKFTSVFICVLGILAMFNIFISVRIIHTIIFLVIGILLILISIGLRKLNYVAFVGTTVLLSYMAVVSLRLNSLLQIEDYYGEETGLLYAAFLIVTQALMYKDDALKHFPKFYKYKKVLYILPVVTFVTFLYILK